MKRLLEEARKLIAIPSIGLQGNEKIAHAVHLLMSDRGLNVQTQQVLHSLEGVSKQQFNVIGILGDPLIDRKNRKGLLLTAHLDTAPPGVSTHWHLTGGNPFGAVITQERVYGSGAAEGKVDFLCRLHAVQKFREKKLKSPIYLVGTCGNMFGMFGTQYLIESGAVNPRYSLVGAPTSMRIVHRHKCAMHFKIAVGYQMMERDARGFNRKVSLHSIGRIAHSARPMDGQNAILYMFHFLKKALGSGFEIQLTKFSGGDGVITVPDQATAEFFLISHQFEDFKRFFREQTKNPVANHSLKMELGGLGDIGISFLPETWFKCMAEIFGMVENLSNSLESARNAAFDLSYSTSSIVKVDLKHGRTELYFDLRLLPEVSTEEKEKEIKVWISEIAGRFPSFNIVMSKEASVGCLESPDGDEFATHCREAARQASLDTEVSTLPIATEAAVLAKRGFSALVFGSGELAGNLCCPNESNLISHIQKATFFYERLIERACL